MPIVYGCVPVHRPFRQGSLSLICLCVPVNIFMCIVVFLTVAPKAASDNSIVYVPICRRPCFCLYHPPSLPFLGSLPRSRRVFLSVSDFTRRLTQEVCVNPRFTLPHPPPSFPPTLTETHRAHGKRGPSVAEGQGQSRCSPSPPAVRAVHLHRWMSSPSNPPLDEPMEETTNARSEVNAEILELFNNM